jgi:hypothetical protein
MRRDFDGLSAAGLPTAGKEVLWIALVTGSSVVFSLALACATPACRCLDERLRRVMGAHGGDFFFSSAWGA